MPPGMPGTTPTTKVCTKCGLPKPLAGGFHRQAKNKDGLHYWCKPCALTYRKAQHRRNPERTRASALRLHRRNRQFLLDYLAAHPCLDCGYTNPIALQFDHVRGIKQHNLSDMMRYSIARVLNEITKCEVVCANCHTIRTARRLNWYAITR